MGVSGMVDRQQPAGDLPEREMLSAWLEYQRATLAMKCADVPDDRLAEQSVPPSSLSLLGILRHMADVERHWFGRILLAEDPEYPYFSSTETDAAFDGAEKADPTQARAVWSGACERSREAIARVPDLDTMSAGRAVSARYVLMHAIQEYARHNGHADLLRERIDGVTGM
jgi:uncharacterized damage-inducible protein DinB